jgi:hypothetical protein
MIPLTVALENCNELLEDWRRRQLGTDAREYADKALAPRKWDARDTYFGRIITEHEQLYWMDCYKKRLARIGRMA